MMRRRRFDRAQHENRELYLGERGAQKRRRIGVAHEILSQAGFYWP